jgi:hypothetical protein
MTYHFVMKVSGITSKSSQIATFLVVEGGGASFFESVDINSYVVF